MTKSSFFVGYQLSDITRDVAREMLARGEKPKPIPRDSRSSGLPLEWGRESGEGREGNAIRR